MCRRGRSQSWSCFKANAQPPVLPLSSWPHEAMGPVQNMRVHETHASHKHRITHAPYLKVSASDDRRNYMPSVQTEVTLVGEKRAYRRVMWNGCAEGAYRRCTSPQGSMKMPSSTKCTNFKFCQNARRSAHRVSKANKYLSNGAQ